MPWEGEYDVHWSDALGAVNFWFNRPATKMYLELVMAFAWFLTISPPSLSISVLSGCYSSDEDLNSSPTSSPRSPRLVWRETLSCSWTVTSSWKSLLVLVTLAVFDSILSISLWRKMKALFKSTLFTDDGDCGNAAVMVSTSYETLDKQWNFELRIPSETVTADLVTFTENL